MSSIKPSLHEVLHYPEESRRMLMQGFPYSQMNHYVNKITSCYGAYQRIYAGN